MALITTREAAIRLGVDVSRIYHFIADERLPAKKIGRDYVINERDLDKVGDRKPGRPRKVLSRKAKG